MVDVDGDAIGRHLTVIALFGAATQGATPDQLSRLKNEAIPMMRDVSNPLVWVVERIFEIRGHDWNPVHAGNGWGTWLDALLTERQQRN